MTLAATTACEEAGDGVMPPRFRSPSQTVF